MNGKARGHMLLVAIVLATIMSLMLALALQPIRTSGQRLKERELVYRGEHLAAGIRRFYLTKGRFPFELNELMEHRPRFVRQLYPDPMTDQGDWTLVYLDQQDRESLLNLHTVGRVLSNLETREGQQPTAPDEERDTSLGVNPDRLFQMKGRQITGVRSQSSEEGLRIYDESRIYSDWLFSALPKRKVELERLQRMLMNQQ